MFLVLVATGLIALFITGSGKKKKLDERLSFRKKDKIPYGTWVAFQSLPEMFPGASVYNSRKEPGSWDAIGEEDSRQLFIAITPKFMADDYEMRKLLSFVEKGNDVFISTKEVSVDVEDMLDCNVSESGITVLFGEENEFPGNRNDSFGIVLKQPPFATRSVYKYPGRDFDAFFTRINPATTDVLGSDDAGRANFIHLRAGKGNFYLHLAPLAFSNYFLLHRNNFAFYENALSVISPETRKIVWDEFYLTKRDSAKKEKKKSWIRVLSRYPGLKAALLTALITLVLFMLLEMRRKQRYIPVVAKPRNDSLDFVKTIGRLYYDRSDHKNLSRKMASYFLEHVRSRYKMPTGNLDETFIRDLQFKSGVEEQEIRRIVTFIKYSEDAPAVTADELAGFHKQLEMFYNKA